MVGMPPNMAPRTPNVLRGRFTDGEGANITPGSPVTAINETTTGNRRVVIRTTGEAIINIANMSNGSPGDIIRLQCIDKIGNGDIWYATAVKGAANITKTLERINGITKRSDKLLLRSTTK